MKITYTLEEVKEILASKHECSYDEIDIDIPPDSTSQTLIPFNDILCFIMEYKFEFNSENTCVNKVQSIRDLREFVAARKFYISLCDAKVAVERIIELRVP